MSSGSQSSLVFLDTNIWLYAFIVDQDTNKSKKAKDLIRRSEVLISSQVINEVCVNLIKKAKVDESSIQQIIEAFYSKYRIGVIDRALLLRASDLRETWQFSFWDSLIVSSALAGGAEILFSEDMNDGLSIENRLKISNPFAVK
ncbi:MAG TPA: PIN domain-containing protein [Blastocatellia bacterium]|nr:PIN domain-containing protein [Blastocatellia bacterium]